MRHPKRPSGSRILVATTLAIAFRAPFVAGQSYGTNDQTLTIGMAEAPLTSAGFIDTDGYLYDTGFDEPGPPFVVPLHLPDGAEVRQVCAYANDLHADTSAMLSLIAVKLVPGGGGDPYVLTIPGSAIQTTPGAGYSSYCTGSMAYTLRNAVDLDGDQVPDNTVYFLKVEPGYHGGIGAVLVTWGRQVSPPPDTPTFGDVPANDVSFPHIEALAASGITAGCGGGNYCPNALLTRRQMAVYLAKAFGLHWTD